jgi:hypothetical protein
VRPRSFAYPCGQKFVGRGDPVPERKETVAISMDDSTLPMWGVEEIWKKGYPYSARVMHITEMKEFRSVLFASKEEAEQLALETERKLMEATARLSWGSSVAAYAFFSHPNWRNFVPDQETDRYENWLKTIRKSWGWLGL